MVIVNRVMYVLFCVMRSADITLYPASGVSAVIMISDISFQSLMDNKLGLISSGSHKPDLFSPTRALFLPSSLLLTML